MKIKDLKPGMKVFIRENLEVGREYGNDIFVESMKSLTGLREITGFGNAGIKVNNECWCFTSEMIDWDKTERLNNKDSALIYDRTTLEGQIDGQEIKVVRSPEDKEDLEKAVMMGLIQSLGYTYKDVKELENKVKTIWRPQENEKYYFVTSCGVVVYTYNYDSQVDKELFDFGNCFKTEDEANQKAVEFRQLFKE